MTRSIRWHSLATQLLAIAAVSLLAFMGVVLVVVINVVTTSVAANLRNEVAVAQNTLQNLFEEKGAANESRGKLRFGTYAVDGDTHLINQTKAVTGCDASIYQVDGDKAATIATTFIQNDRRMLGVDMPLTPLAAISHSKPYEGTETIGGISYLGIYRPIVDAGGRVIGATFAGIPQTSIKAAAARTISMVAGVALIALIVILTIVYLFFRNIRNDASAVVYAARALAAGELEYSAEVRSRNEFGQISRAFDEMISYQREMAGHAEAIAAGNLTQQISPHGPDDRLGNALTQMNANLAAIVGQIQETADTLAGTSSQLETTSERSSATVVDASSAMSNVAQGYDALSQAATALDTIVNQFSKAIDAIARGAVDQAAQVNLASDDATGMFADVERVARASEALAAAGTQTRSAALAGERAVAETVTEMNAIAAAVREATLKIQELENISAQIGSIVEAVDEIADQTNLLALNAAIEAARAGEHGRGFAVVADEVRKLAERSASENKQIGDLVRQVQRRTFEAVNAIGDGAAKAVAGTEKAAVGGAALREILESVEQTVRQVGEIAGASEVMARSAKSVMESIQSINIVIEENSAATEEMAAQAGQITDSIGAIAATSSQHRGEAERVARISVDVRRQVEEVQDQARELDDTARNLRSLMSHFSTDGTRTLTAEETRALPGRTG